MVWAPWVHAIQEESCTCRQLCHLSFGVCHLGDPLRVVVVGNGSYYTALASSPPGLLQGIANRMLAYLTLTSGLRSGSNYLLDPCLNQMVARWVTTQERVDNALCFVTFHFDLHNAKKGLSVYTMDDQRSNRIHSTVSRIIVRKERPVVSVTFCDSCKHHM